MTALALGASARSMTATPVVAHKGDDPAPSRLVGGALIAASVVAGLGAAVGVGVLMHRVPGAAAEAGHAGFDGLHAMGNDALKFFAPLSAFALVGGGTHLGLQGLRDRAQ